MAKVSTCLPPIHPGESLRVDLMEPLGISANRVALDLRVPVTRISEIVKGRRGITADTALRLGRFFGTTAQFWMNLQTAYELEVAERGASANVDREVLPRSA